MKTAIKSMVEKRYLHENPQELLYPPEEKIPTMIVDSFPALGRISALRFLEWVQQNPDGVVSLPTGKSPQYFIAEVHRILSQWNSKEIQHLLDHWGIDSSKKIDTGGLHFVQIDEFYPINPSHTNSFHYYVRKYYLDGFGLDPKKALLINCEKIGLDADQKIEEVWGEDEVDLSLRYRSPVNLKEEIRKSVIERVDQWCHEYEEKIQEIGGIGFFLGGIGPDGHIGFNIRGSDPHSTTRLSPINYETQAASASDLGGIEVSRKRKVITIGLSTITSNPDCVAIIIAAGEAKAKIVAESICSPLDVTYPASSLQKLTNARFYLTNGAAKQLKQRWIAGVSKQEQLSEDQIAKIVIDTSVASGKKIDELSREDYSDGPFGKLLLEKSDQSIEEINRKVSDELKEKMRAGMVSRENRRFLHTEPHHDDIMLGYLPFAVRNIRVHSNTHFFATLTSGFTSVTNTYMLNICRKMLRALETDKYNFRSRMETGYFDPKSKTGRDRDVYTYLDGVAAGSEELKDEGTLRRFLRDLVEIYEDTDLDNLRERVSELENYFETQYPGKKDLDYIQKLKGMCREWESACLWGYFGWSSDSIRHLRLGFYTGDIFTEEPTMSRDVGPVLQLFREIKPDVITVALDPEASGPDTHYKVLQAVAEAVKVYVEEEQKDDLEVIGYRNVWYRFHPSEAEIFVPVSLNMLTLQHYSFMNTYISQKDASFPSYEHDGPFPELAQKIQVEQYEMLKTCLGQDFFYAHESALIRATRGFVFIRSMKPDEFISLAREVRKNTENR